MLLSSLDAELWKDCSEMVLGPKSEWTLNFSLQNEQTKSWTSVSNSEWQDTDPNQEYKMEQSQTSFFQTL